jgi:hypothetical protein
MADMTTNPDDGEPPSRKLNDDLIKAFRRVLFEGNFREVACKRLRIGRSTFHRWMDLGKRYPSGIYGRLRDTVLEAEASAERLALRTILAAGHTEDPKHLQWWLERKYPQRWARYRGELRTLQKEVAEIRKMLGETANDETPG